MLQITAKDVGCDVLVTVKKGKDGDELNLYEVLAASQILDEMIEKILEVDKCTKSSTQSSSARSCS